MGSYPTEVNGAAKNGCAGQFAKGTGRVRINADGPKNLAIKFAYATPNPKADWLARPVTPGGAFFGWSGPPVWLAHG